MPVLAEWDAPGMAPLSDEARHFPGAQPRGARAAGAAAFSDIEDAPELRDPGLGSLDSLRRLGTRAVMGTPIVVFDRMIGVFGLHRGDPHQWTVAERTLLESVAREVGLAIHTARLLENAQRR